MSGVEVVAPLIGEVGALGVRKLYATIASKFASSRKLDDNYNILLKDMESLLAIKKDKEREVERNNHKDTTNAYKLWTNRASDAAEEVQKLKVKYEEKTIPRWRIQRRSRLSEKMEKKSSCVRELMKDECLRDFLVDKPPEPVLKEINVPQISGYPTLQSALKNTLDLLKNNKIKVIGVCGTKGVGKTTIMRNLNNNEEVAKLFDIVIFVKATADDLKLQEKIANRLMLDIGADASRIRVKLEEKKFLLILDEVEDAIDLEQLGIPSNNNGSKVVIATQFSRAYKLSGVQRVVNVTKLTPGEGWKMFKDIVTSCPGIDFPHIRCPAELVYKRWCSNLPLLIYHIAHTLKLQEYPSSWWSELEHLEPWPELGNQGLQELYSCLKFCYDQLQEEEKKKCFLYTSLYPADSKVYTDYLVECFAAQGLLGDINDKSSYQNARNLGIKTLEHLAGVSLLEKGEGMIYVSMNDCMRQLALHISSKNQDCSLYLQESEKSENLSNSRAWQQTKTARWVSLRQPLDLPTTQDPSVILTLLLRKNPELTTIPPTFFENMNKLLLLDLYSSKITKLPWSLSRLTGLRCLFLNSCKELESLPFEIRLLQSLEVLDIRDTKVTFIPLEVGLLTNLRCLRIPFIASSEAQNVNVISKLHRLEELTIQVISYDQWCKDAEKVLVDHVVSLEKVTHLECCFPSPIILGKFLEKSKSWSCQQQHSFRFYVGCENSEGPQILKSFEYKITNYLRYCDGEQKDDLKIIEVLQIDTFELVCHKDIEILSNFAGIMYLKCIRGLLIEGCNKVLTIVSGDTGFILPSLEQLYLKNLRKLQCVFGGPLHSESFSNLQILSLKTCPSLSEIFSNGTIQHFSQLQKLKIEDCSKIEKLLGENVERDVLPKLEILLLVNLPNFKTICSTHTLAWSSLELLRIHKCPMLKTLPLDRDNAVNLRSIKGQQEWWEGLERTNNDEVYQRLQPMFVASNEYFS